MRTWKDHPDDVEALISFTRTGTYRPGRISGPPEDCYPDEYEDDRTLASIQIGAKEIERKNIPPAVVKWFDELLDSLDLEVPEE